MPIYETEIFGSCELEDRPDDMGLGFSDQGTVHREVQQIGIRGVDKMTPKTLRGALNQIQKMLSGTEYSEDLWNTLVALRGPDSRNRKIKSATTAVIRSTAFPKRPCDYLSIFGTDSRTLAARRRSLFTNREDTNHFREHTRDAFNSLGLALFEENVWNK
jgi:hypothetical protein